jgi:ATP-binding cassette subfamily G (WHITE) protein 2
MEVVKLISQIASSDSCTVVSTIHQPSKEMLEQFSHLCLLDKGELAFLGPIEELKPFFDSIGWPIGERKTPAEKVITVMDEL